METGTVLRFNKIKGYGFIKPHDRDAEVFIHFSEVQSSGYKELKEGQKVSYTLTEGEKGLFARDVSVIE